MFSAKEIEQIRVTFAAGLDHDRKELAHDDGVPATDILAKYPRFVHPHRKLDHECGKLARGFMTDNRLLSVCEDVMGGPVYGCQSMFYFKPPGARGQALHQDNLFLRAHPETCMAAWIAVDDCDSDNGGLILVPRSHINDILCHGEADDNLSFGKQELKLPSSARKFQTHMSAGDVLFFHGAMIHGSMPNTTTDRFRRSLIFHYIPQASEEVCFFYQPLVKPDGTEVRIDESELGGPCGSGWTEP